MHARLRWTLLWVALLGNAAGGSHARDPRDARDPLAADDGLPDALDDRSEEQPLQLQESRNVGPRAFSSAAYNALSPGGFRAAGAAPAPLAELAELAELAGYSRPRPRPAVPARLQHAAPEREREPEEPEPEEADEPDRLALLLQQSRFECQAKPSGYYADQELACEVFHYCQDGVKHSWICPDGFTFHQVHLICMPPTHDNICQQSAKYHFVNDYLYRPVNEEEKARRPDLPLKYADRYYPAEVYNDDRRDYDDEEEPRPRPSPPQPSPRPQQQQQQQQRQQVFRSAEEVNIPLGQRRPQPSYNFDF